MGIRHLETYVCSNVYNGYVKVDIEYEIRRSIAAQRPSPPIIVIDIMSLYRPVSEMDFPGLLCGGRYNHVTYLLEQFFGKLKNLGAKLVFFMDGPVQDTKYDTWFQRQDDKYNKMLQIINAVDRGHDLAQIVNRLERIIPNCTLFPVMRVAKKYGETRISVIKECDQELATYAKQVGALAIISNDTDFMIYEGFWQYWSAKDLNFETLNTMGYNRLALVKNLGLSFKQMRLLATLGGNDIIKYEEVQHFHSTLGHPKQKFPRLAKFVRDQSPPKRLLLQDDVLCRLLSRVFGTTAVQGDLKERFKASLNFYDTDYEAQHDNVATTSSDPVIDVLIKMNNTFFYQMWINKPVNVTAYFLDMRKGEFGEQYPNLVIPIVMRQAGIILYHKQMLPDCSKRTIVLKMSHEAEHSFQEFPVQFPSHVAPPPLLDILSRRNNDDKRFHEVGLQLFCWIASDTLDYHRLQSVPERLLAPLLTLYYLVEKQMLQVFEADVLLQVTYDVAFQTYDFQTEQYPTKVAKRPFRIAFLFLKIYNHFHKAATLMGYEKEPFLLFDGVRFHRLYTEWVNRGADSVEQIKSWRIYEGFAI